MGSKFSSILAYRGALYETPSCPVQPAERLEVAVFFTGMQHTVQALKKAGELARGLNARIRLLVPQVVAYPAPLECPPVLLEFSENRFRSLAAAEAIETRVEIHLCRDVSTVFDQALAPGSMVVIGGGRRWWPTPEQCLVRRLHRLGHEVIFVSNDRKEEPTYA